MPVQMLSVEEIKAKHSWKIPLMLDSLKELGKWNEDVESRLVREGKLKIVKGRYHWLDEKPVNRKNK